MEQRNNIFEILEENTEKIPEGVYLSIMNQLKNIKESENHTFENLFNQFTAEIFLRPSNFVAGELTKTDYIALAQLDNDDVFITSQISDRRVLRHSREGRRIIDNGILFQKAVELRNKENLTEQDKILLMRLGF